MRKHIWYYTSFIVLQLVGLSLILLTASNHILQFLAILLTTGFYLFWALVHHELHHDLHLKIVAEYVLISALGIAISLLLFHS